jgi:hypothetical protein
MKKFLAKFNELLFSPIAILVFGLAYYGVYKYFGPEAGLIPPGYFTNVLAGAAIFYIAGFMSTFAIWITFRELYLILFDPEKIEGVVYEYQKTLATCVYFAFYALSIWALTSML